MPIPSSLVTLLVGMALVLTGLWVGTNVNLLPLDASANAPVYDSLFRVLFSIGTILFLGIVGLVVFSLVRFRRRSGDHTDGLAIEGNLLLEIVWTAIPAVVVLFVGIYSYDIYERMGGMSSLNDHSAMHRMPAMETMEASVTAADPALAATDPLKAPRVWGGIGTAAGETNVLPVEVTAMQFAFIFHYPEGDIISGELHVPNGRPVELRMKANDVIHAFWVPQFRLKQDVIPGQPTVLTFTPTKAGSYPIICAELCGPYHGGMRSTVVVHEPDAYDAWLQKNSPVAATVASAAVNPTA
ncbi:cytochrome c oxidase subunit 2 [Cyanobium sp. Copco_Reservoir_LC18]|uniref:cytochrome c oxidase subunit II n=1 Tax=Cyanobium sp. Copco_Reservoir_LC18 TaxID=1328305 RepID=UPI0013567566|nr:cytochrome c oxidase subunit II [Cyanobium sp. Copco_Reservoir_LC18]KAF0653218.1 cytochrome c oxidase subunit 2 [Cyanobium sp. Copco_Reservoir_LC18]